MATTTAEDLLRLAVAALMGQGLAEDDATAIATEFVVADLSGVRTHGVNKLASLNLGDLAAEPEIRTVGALLSIDGRGSNGFLLLRRVATLVADQCSHQGLSAAFMTNFSRYSSLYPYTELLARRGFVAILANSAGPPAVSPHGGVDPITGTNPLCFSFPLPDGRSQTFDFATSEMVWGEIRQAALEGRGLRSGPFLDAAGEVTTVPTDVNAVRSFGAAKGWSLNLALEIICGLLTGGKAGSAVQSEFDCGAMLLAIDPDRTVGISQFAQSVSVLFDEIRSSRAEDPSNPVRCPGDRGRSSQTVADRFGESVEIPDATLDLLHRLASGERVSELSSNPLFN